MASKFKEDQVALRLKKPISQAKLERFQGLRRSASLGHQSRTLDFSEQFLLSESFGEMIDLLGRVAVQGAHL